MAEGEVPANIAVAHPKRGFPRAFGRYILEKSLSRGGMGEVYLAVARGIGTRCVIKTIRGDLTGDKEFVGRFADEAKIMVRISHENIIRVFDCGKVGADFYIAMEFVHGRDLGDVLDRAYERGEPMPKGHGLYITRQILKGLDYAHNLTDELGRPMRLVHRDISPQNILVGFDGSVKLIDFGLARTELLPGRTQGALAVGKYGYMSPEQARHERIDGRADIYSTGVMLFEVFTGDRLVDEQDQATLWSRVLNPKHRKPSTVIPDLPKEIDELIMSAVAVKVEDRFSDAKSMLRFADSMRTKASDKQDLIQYLRHLYPNVDFKPPPMPDLSGQLDFSEQSMIIAMSEDGAKSVFGKGDLPIEWTRQIKWADVQAELDKRKRAKEAEEVERKRAREEEERRRRKDAPITEPAISEPPTRSSEPPRLPSWDSMTGQEATVVHDGDGPATSTGGGVRVTEEPPSGPSFAASSTYRTYPGTDDSPTTIAKADDSLPPGVLSSEDHPTRYDKKRFPDRESNTDSARPAKLGEVSIRGEQFRDDEQTVMMSAPPPRGGWAGDQLTGEETVAPTRVSVSPPPTPSPPSPAVRRAIQERQALRGRPSREAPPPAVIVRSSVGVEATAPDRGPPVAQTREAPTTAAPDRSGPNLVLIGLLMMAVAIIVLLLLLFFWA
jgi:serine/threonine protein kinase